MTASELDYAWLGGLFEGEGCFQISRRGNGLSDLARNRRHVGYSLSIRSTDLDVLEKVQRIGGGNIYSISIKRMAHAKKQQWAWSLGDPVQIRQLMKRLYPHLGERRQARWADCLELRKQYEESLEPRIVFAPGVRTYKGTPCRS